MINLVPDDLRINKRYALRNTQLLRYTVIAAFTMVAIGAITGVSILDMQHTQSNLQKQINDQNQKLAVYKPLAAQGKQLSDELTTINSLLARQVTFSTLLPRIAKIMPPGSVLQALDVSTSELLPASALGTSGSSTSTSSSAAQSPFVIQAAVNDRSVAATLLQNIKATTDLFTDADIVSVTQSTAGSADAHALASTNSRYPYQVTINAYLKKITPQSLTSQSGNAK